MSAVWVESPISGFDTASLTRLAQTLEVCQADWLVLYPTGTRLQPALAAVLTAAVADRPDVDLFYAEEQRPDHPTSSLPAKPDWNPALLLAYDYVRWPLLVRREALLRLGGIDPQAGAALGVELLLRAWRGGMAIARLPQPLLQIGPDYGPTPAEVLAPVLRQHLAACSPDLTLRPGRRPQTWEVRRTWADPPPVTLVVPTCQTPRLDGQAGPQIRQLLTSLECSSWPLERLTVLIGDDAPGDDYLDGDWPFTVRRLRTERPAGAPFNYAAKMNRLWRAATDEYLVLLNDDIEIRSPDWLEALLTFLWEPGVGGVGARLLFPDGRIQHAGMAGGVLNTVAHPWYGWKSDRPTYGHWAEVHRDWSMVTGAVFATRRSLLEQVNGFDEQLSLEYNDVDLCLRLGLLGYRIVCTPHAELIHHESISRGESRPRGQEILRFRRRWQELLVADSQWHPGLPDSWF